MKARKGPLLALTWALVGATSASSASAWENPHLDESLELCDQGSFFVGGVPRSLQVRPLVIPRRSRSGKPACSFRSRRPAANGRSSSFTAHRTRAQRWIRRRMARRAGFPMLYATLGRLSSWTSRGVAVDDVAEARRPALTGPAARCPEHAQAETTEQPHGNKGTARITGLFHCVGRQRSDHQAVCRATEAARSPRPKERGLCALKIC
jgi:hypothetical protein